MDIGGSYPCRPEKWGRILRASAPSARFFCHQWNTSARPAFSVIRQRQNFP
jgi:hypothetical protein